ncbi:MAG: RidA family protein [Deltaproteobacteria bacterium]|nr:RidA family protein [Deltaproteobacteria bacterium]
MSKPPWKEIRTDKAPAPVGPYSQAIEAGGFVFCSGQIALDPASGSLVGDTPAAQADKLMDNVRAVLEAAGLGMNSIVKTTIFLLDMKAFAEVNAAYERKLGGHKPARSTVAVSALPKGALVEIEVLAVR